MSFVPPFCPNSACPSHKNPDSALQPWFSKAGTRETQVVGTIQKFRCRTCRRGFSTRTFDVDYWTHKTIDYTLVRDLLVGGSGLRQACRTLGVSPSLLSNRHHRLTRQALALHAEALEDWDLREALVFDGFESFAHSQYYPNNLHLLATADSQFVVAFHGAVLRRKGRMTDYQKAKRQDLEKLWRADPKAIFKSCRELFEFGCRKAFGAHLVPIQLRTDEHPVYPRALRSLVPYGAWLEAGALDHQRTNSALPRTVDNPLFAVNYLDRELRKDLAEHVRETVRFARRIEFSLERAAVHLVHHNYFKAYRILGKDQNLTHAERAGMSRQRVEDLRTKWTRLRAFGWRLDLEGWALDLWRRRIQVPVHPVRPLARHLMTA